MYRHFIPTEVIGNGIYTPRIYRPCSPEFRFALNMLELNPWPVVEKIRFLEFNLIDVIVTTYKFSLFYANTRIIIINYNNAMHC